MWKPEHREAAERHGLRYGAFSDLENGWHRRHDRREKACQKKIRLIKALGKVKKSVQKLILWRKSLRVGNSTMLPTAMATPAITSMR